MAPKGVLLKLFELEMVLSRDQLKVLKVLKVAKDQLKQWINTSRAQITEIIHHEQISRRFPKVC